MRRSIRPRSGPLSQVGASGTKIVPGESTDKGETKDRHLREHECFADVAEGDAFRCLMQRGLEALNRFVKSSELRRKV